MAGLNKLLEPVDVLLLKHASNAEEMDQAVACLDATGRLDGITLRFLVEQTLLVIPVRVFPLREIPGHFEVKRDCNQGLACRCGALLPIRRNRGNGFHQETTAHHGGGGEKCTA
jgi:hypothetical protein